MAHKSRLATYADLISATDSLESRLGARIDRFAAEISLMRGEFKNTLGVMNSKLDRLLTVMDRLGYLPPTPGLPPDATSRPTRGHYEKITRALRAPS